MASSWLIEKTRVLFGNASFCIVEETPEYAEENPKLVEERPLSPPPTYLNFTFP